MTPRAAALIPGLLAPHSEADLSTQVQAYLKLFEPMGLVWRRTNSGMAKRGPHWVHLAPAGTPDITGHMPDGRALYIELKDPKRKASRDDEKRRAAIAKQEAFVAQAAAAGCVAFRATTLEQVAERLGREVHG